MNEDFFSSEYIAKQYDQMAQAYNDNRHKFDNSAQLDELQRFVLEELTRHERLVLMLFYAEGLSLGEIAEVLDLPEATIVKLFTKTIETLRANFG